MPRRWIGPSGGSSPSSPSQADPRGAAALRRVAHLAGAVPTAPTRGVPTEGRPAQRLTPRACQASTSASTSTSVVVGGMILDLQAAPSAGVEIRRGTSVPGVTRQTPGGVGRNIAEGLARMAPRGVPPPLLVSAVGDDLAGSALLAAWSGLGASVAGVRVCEGAATPVVATVLDAHGEVASSVADTSTVEAGLDPAWVARFERDVAAANIVILDGNCTPDALAAAAAAAASASSRPGIDAGSGEALSPRVWFEPVSIAKSTRAGTAGILGTLDFVSPNAGELRAMANDVRARRGEPLAADPGAGASTQSALHFSSAQEAVETMHADIEVMLREGVVHVVLTLGEMGVLLSTRASAGDGGGGRGPRRPRVNPSPRGGSDRDTFQVVHRHFPALPASVVSLVGAGDSLVAGCAAALLGGLGVEEAVAMGVAASRRAIEDAANVPSRPDVAFGALREDSRSVLAGVQTVKYYPRMPLSGCG